MTAQSAGHDSVSASGWRLTPGCYNAAYRTAALRAIMIALALAAVVALMVLL